MIEQMCMEAMIPDEQKAFELIYPELKDIIYNAPIDSGILIFQEIADCSSVYFLDSSEIFFRVRLRKKTRYILFSEEFVDLLPPDTETIRTKSEAGMVRIPMQTYKDILKYVPALRGILERLCRRHRDFGCCGRYEACSDAKACIHPDPKFALGCMYRQNLRDGKIFYGKNRNID